MKLKIIYTIFSLIILLSCQKNEKNINYNDITINLGPYPLTIDPSLNVDIWTMTYLIHCFEGLVTKDKDNNIIPGIAEKWDISDDGLTYTFYLRTNAKWSDGKPVTANDFVYSWRRVVDPNVAAKFSYFMEPIKNAKEIIAGEKSIEELGVKAIDDYTFEVTLSSPTAYFIDFISSTIYFPTRKDIIEKYGDNWTFNPETYIGNGAFKMIERIEDEKIIMIKNTNYYNIDNIKPEKLTFILMEDGNASLGGFINKTLDFVKPFPKNDIENLQNQGFVHIENLAATYYYYFNLTNEIFKDIRIRKALAISIDRNYIVKKITKLNEKPINGIVPYGIKGRIKDFRDESDEYFSILEKDYTNNIIEAKKLLAEAGYPDGKNFPVLELTTTTREFDIKIAEFIQNIWKENLGINIRINKYEYPIYISFMYGKNFGDIGTYVYYADFNDPINFLNLIKKDIPNNFGSFDDELYNSYLNIASITNDNEYRMDLLFKAEKNLINNFAIIPLYSYSEAFLVSPNLKGVEYDPMGMVRFHHAYLE